MNPGEPPPRRQNEGEGPRPDTPSPLTEGCGRRWKDRTNPRLFSRRSDPALPNDGCRKAPGGGRRTRPRWCGATAQPPAGSLPGPGGPVSTPGGLASVLRGLESALGDLVSVPGGPASILEGLVSVLGALVSALGGLVSLLGGLVPVPGGPVSLLGGPRSLPGGPGSIPGGLASLQGGPSLAGTQPPSPSPASPRTTSSLERRRGCRGDAGTPPGVSGAACACAPPPPQPLTPAQEVQDEPLGQQHLGGAQHAAPAAVRAPGGPRQRREAPPVRQPQPGGEIPLETVQLLCRGGGGEKR